MGQARYAGGDWAGALGYYVRVLDQPDLPVWIRGWSTVKSGHGWSASTGSTKPGAPTRPRRR